MNERLGIYFEMMRGKKFIYGFVAIIACALVLLVFLWGRRESSESAQTPPATYHNPSVRVAFQYPSTWQPDTQFPLIDGIATKIGGPEGFFAVDMIGGAGNATSGAMAQALAEHELKPYGENPEIVKADFGGFDGIFVFNRENTNPVNRNDAMLMVRYPKPIEFNGSTFEFVMIFGTRDFIQSVPDSFRFLD